MTRFFGKPWGSSINRGEQVPCPAGESCRHCDEMFLEGDQGVVIDPDAPFHLPCLMRTIMGSVGHQIGKCNCVVKDGTAFEDPPELTLRQAAEIAFVLYWIKTPGMGIPVEMTDLTRKWAAFGYAYRDQNQIERYAAVDALDKVPGGEYVPVIQEWKSARRGAGLSNLIAHMYPVSQAETKLYSVISQYLAKPEDTGIPSHVVTGA